MRLKRFIPFVLILPLSLLATEQGGGSDGTVLFDQHIHPVLEGKCFECHGVEKIEGGLALTHRDGLLQGGNRGPGINTANLAESTLLKMISHEDPKQRMPFEKPPLSPDEIAKVKEWVMMGAPYNPDREFLPKVKPASMVIDDKARSYWAYQPPKKSDLPKVPGTSFKNPIDAFIAEELSGLEISPNEKAQAKHLLRRAFYDLTGLAPRLEDLEAFEKGPQDEEAWKQVIDQLLASPHFGERLAILWLDLVRYAETNGFERDSEKPFIWRYRDYVINAFNADKPYDQFIIEQLAGDEVDPPTLDAHIATGYLALMQRDDEPADRPQAHSDMVGDMVDVTGEAFLGSTLGCAKCHDHKGDPIRQADYYSMMAFFDPIKKTQLKTVEHYWKDPNHQKQLEEKVKQSQAQMDKLWATVDVSKLDPFIKKPDTSIKPILPLSSNGVRVDWQLNYAQPKELNWNQPSYAGNDFNPVKMPIRAGRADPPFAGHADAWEANKPKIFMRKDFGLTTIPERVIFYSKANTETLTLFINGVQVFKGKPYQAGEYQFYPLSKNDLGALTTGKNTIGAIVENKNKQVKYFNLGMFTAPITSIPPQHYAGLFPERIEALYGKPFLDTFVPLHQQIKNNTAQANAKGLPYMSQAEVAAVENPRIHIRGNVHAPGKAIPMAVPAVMVPSNEKALIPVTGDFKKTGSHGRRLALANWITSRDNPLTARVMVNRLWHHCFGEGIVPSLNDFGTLGEEPGNQKLLDWLAVEFMESGWSLKHMLRLMLTSETYQRSTAPNELAMKADPMNRSHWRHTPRRLSAEEIRDTFLGITDELQLQKPKLPFVRPTMPEAVLATSSQPSKAWPPTAGIEANSRSVYVHVKRSIKLPMLSAFDAPERDMSCAARFATTVPTQALTMLNSQFVNDRAGKFAERISARHPENVDEQIRYGFQLATGRAAEDDESSELRKLYEELTTDYKLTSNDALKRVCLLVLNLNETIYLD